MSDDLVSWCTAQLKTAYPQAKDGNIDPRMIDSLLLISESLRSSVGSLLRPLFSGLFSVPIDLKTAAQILPPLKKLLVSIDTLAAFVRTSGLLSLHPQACVCRASNRRCLKCA